MSTRKFGLMSSKNVTRVIAGVLTFGLVAGFAATSLAQAGIPMWMIVPAVLIVLAVPVVAVMRSDDRGEG